MTDSYFHELNLPQVPVRNMDILLKYNKWTDAGYHIWKYPRFYLNDEFLMALNRLGVSPGYIVFFTNDHEKSLDDRVIHTDLVTRKDPRVIKTLNGAEWRPATFGINFEVTGSTNDFYWYKMPDTIKPVEPIIPPNTDTFLAWLHGVHYGRRGQTGIPPGSIELANTQVTTKPTLVRADVPHSTSFTLNPNGDLRIAASIRFYEDWTWEEACEIFRPLIRN
jgi:hypothetical protein